MHHHKKYFLIRNISVHSLHTNLLLFSSHKVVFKNLASRPYSFHLHGVYDKTQGSFNPGTGPEGSKAEDVPGDPVPPGEERVYNWRISRRQGPSASEFDCKAGAYYSNLNMVIQCATQELGWICSIWGNIHVVFTPSFCFGSDWPAFDFQTSWNFVSISHACTVN